MSWDTAGYALTEVLHTIQRILLPWVSVSKEKASMLIKEMREKNLEATVESYQKDVAEICKHLCRNDEMLEHLAELCRKIHEEKDK